MIGGALRIVSIGECTIDQYPDTKAERIGGISFNFAVHAKRCGAEEVSLVSCAGDDRAAQIRKKLADENVDASRVAIRKGSTARQKILLNGTGERIFPAGGYDPGVLSSFTMDTQDIAFVRDHNVIVGACFQQMENVFDQIMEIPFHGWRVADFLDLSDYNADPDRMRTFCNRLKIAFVSGDARMARLLEPVSKETDCVIVVTLGSRGSVAFMKGQSLQQPAVPVELPVDSTGCGDAFQSAFTVSYWRDHDVRRALRCGAEQAARVIQHLGAVD